MDLYYRERGSGKPLLMLHGLFGSADNLGGLARLITEGFRTILPDLRNHGRSPHADAMTYADMAEDIVRLMDKLGIEKANIFGHSMGGKVAMQLALKFPERVDKLIVADIAPVTYEANHTKILEGMRAVVDAKADSRQAAQEILACYENDASVLSFLMTNWRRAENGHYSWRHNLDAIADEYANIAAGNSGSPFEGEVLFLRGALSNYILADHRGRILDLFPNAAVRTIEGTGHWLHAEKPAMVARAVIRFLGA